MNLEDDLENDFLAFEQEVQNQTSKPILHEPDKTTIWTNPLLINLETDPTSFKANLTETKLQSLFVLMDQISDEMLSGYYSLLSFFSDKFGELESLVLDHSKYAQVVKTILESSSIVNLNFSFCLENQLNLTVILALSKSQLTSYLWSGKSSDQVAEIGRVSKIANNLIHLNSVKQRMLDLISEKTQNIAPNTNEIVGPYLTALLIGKAGGVEKLARIPACNIQLMGGKRERVASLSKISQKLYFGSFASLEIVQKTDENYQQKLIKLLANAVAKSARIDSSKLSRNGAIGKEMLKDLMLKFDKYQLPKTGEMRKPLPMPDDTPKKRRGGRKFRHSKDKLAMTEARFMKNNVKFGTDFGDDVGNEINDLGMLTQAGHGFLKIHKKEQKIGLSKKQIKRISAQPSNSGHMDGLTSTLVFNNTQGINLVMNKQM